MRVFFVLIYLAFFSMAANAEQQCISCHQQAVKDWQQSDHFHAMEKATPATAVGNFNQQQLPYLNSHAKFYKNDEQLFISMPNETGELKEYKVVYTFGHYPLQQYMYEAQPGKIQFFPFAWDSRSKQEGGERWFILHPDQQPHDEFHFSQMGQNWSHMCADCHSSDFKKNFDLTTKTFDSSFSAINVSCASCHGDSKQHLAWAQGDSSIENKGYQHYIGTKTPLFKRQSDGTMKSVTELKSSEQIQVCATCHARRSQLADRTSPHSFMNEFMPALITPELYHVDGQVWDEDYVWGSFLQSKMFNRGVTCSNCHNPHSGKLKLPGNQTCTQCHTSEVFETPKHHGHKIDTAGSQCVDCHMPATTFMQVDARRDHSFRVPRPDLTLKTNAPNACASCHDDKTASWAVAAIKTWHPDSKYMGKEHFSEAFSAADRGLPNASSMLTKIAQNKDYAEIIRASALARMANTPDRNSVVAIVRAVREEEPLKRLGAITAAENFPITEKYRMLKPLLDDPRLPIRTETARTLATMLNQPFPDNLKGAERTKLESVLDEYKQSQLYQAERGFSHTNLGNLALALNKRKEAEQHFLKAIEIEPIFIPAYVNLADLYRNMQSENKAQATLEKGLKVNPNSAAINYSFAMSLIRSGNKKGALDYLKTAAYGDGAASNYVYTYALLLQDLGLHQQALPVLLKTFELTPNNPDVSYTLVQHYLAQKQYQEAYRYAKHLQSLVPGNQQIDQMVQQLQMMLSINP